MNESLEQPKLSGDCITDRKRSQQSAQQRALRFRTEAEKLEIGEQASDTAYAIASHCFPLEQFPEHWNATLCAQFVERAIQRERDELQRQLDTFHDYLNSHLSRFVRDIHSDYELVDAVEFKLNQLAAECAAREKAEASLIYARQLIDEFTGRSRWGNHGVSDTGHLGLCSKQSGSPEECHICGTTIRSINFLKSTEPPRAAERS